MDSVVSVYRAMECREFDAKTRLDVVTIEQIMYSECTWSLFVAPFFPMFVGWHMYTLLCYRQRCILSRFFFTENSHFALSNGHTYNRTHVQVRLHDTVKHELNFQF